MTPITFKGYNVTFAKNQKPYIPLPAKRFPGPEGLVTSCWKLTWKERITILFHGVIWLSCLTFNHPLQPVKLAVDRDKE
jgi:hypothetical protein